LAREIGSYSEYYQYHKIDISAVHVDSVTLKFGETVFGEYIIEHKP